MILKYFVQIIAIFQSNTIISINLIIKQEIFSIFKLITEFLNQAAI